MRKCGLWLPSWALWSWLSQVGALLRQLGIRRPTMGCWKARLTVAWG